MSTLSLAPVGYVFWIIEAERFVRRIQPTLSSTFVCAMVWSIFAYPATAFSTNEDIEAQVSDTWRLYMILTNTVKPVVSGAFTEEGVPRMAQMMQLFRQDAAELRTRPMSIFTITATGMFRYSEDSCQNLLDCVEVGIPVEIVPVTLMRLIAPVTLVGATVFHTVDTLAGLTMAQLIRPGAPVLFGGAPAAFHMKASASPMMAIERFILMLLMWLLPRRSICQRRAIFCGWKNARCTGWCRDLWQRVVGGCSVRCQFSFWTGDARLSSGL